MVLGPLELARSRRPLRRPPAFAWEPEGGVQGRGIGAAARRFRVATTATRWLDPIASGNGLTKATPTGDLWAILGAINQPTTIYVRERAVTLDLAHGGAGTVFVDHCEIIVVKDFDTLEPGSIRHAMSAPLVWTAAGGGSYSAPMAGNYAFTPGNVIDEATLDAYGGGTWLTPVADAAAVAATASSWAKVGSTIYVRTADSRAPDANLLVMKNANNMATVFAGTNLYLEGLELLGGARPFYAPRGGTITLARCKARYGVEEGFGFVDTTRATLIDCAMTGNGSDGVAYTTTPRAVEVRVTSCKNGHPITPTNICNGSSQHAGEVIRVDGVYLDNQGPNLADVLGAKSWNVRCRASGSIATQPTQQVGVWIQGTAWLDGCDIGGNAHADLKAQLEGDVLNVYGTRYATTDGAGVVRASRG